MKKLIIFTLLFLIPSYSYSTSYIDKQLKEAKKNVKYNTTKIQLQNQDYADRFSKNANLTEIKNPKLIKLTEITEISDKDYQKKLADDNKVYEKEIIPTLKKKDSSLIEEPQAVDFYKIYRIAERIIRANNLEYVNWRFAIRKTEDINAFAADTNLIVINTGLYDTFYTNEDALALVIGHEIAHNLLGHQQRTQEMYRNYMSLKQGAQTKVYTNNPVLASAKLATTTGAFAYKTKLYKEYRMMEYMADAEGLNLIIKAGFNPQEALYNLKFFDSMSELNQLLFKTHPMSEDRIKSAQENIYYANPKWVEEGKYNIYNSKVLLCKKSSDRVSIVISKDDSVKRFYSPETLEQKLTRLAYVSYTKGDMKNAAKYFEKLTEISNDYVPYLYLSYAYEYLYKETKDKAYANKSENAVKKAYNLNSSDKYVQEQMTHISNL